MDTTVSLRGIEIEDTQNILKWRNSKAVKRNLYTQDDLTEEQHLNWMRNKVETGFCAQYIIAIRDEDGNKDIGTVFIKNIGQDTKEGEFGIQIGEETARGKGYGRQAAEQILKIAFNELGLERVYLTVMYDNYPAIRSYEKAGFVQEKILKGEYLRGGTYIDIIQMGITRDMWGSRDSTIS